MSSWEARWAPYSEADYAAVLTVIRPDDVVLDIGAGDLRLARRMAAAAQWVVAWEIQAELLEQYEERGVGSERPYNLLAVCVDARLAAVPAGTTVAVLLMRHCAHYALYVEKLRAAGCQRLITNARWGMGVEVIDLDQGEPFSASLSGWYACRRCGATGFAGDDALAVRWETFEQGVDVEGCPRCSARRASESTA